MLKFSLAAKILPFWALLCVSCLPERNASGDAEPLQIHRMERELFGLDTLELSASLGSLAARHEPFFGIHLPNVLGIRPGDTSAYSLLRRALSNPYVREVAHDIDSVYPELDYIEQGLGSAFARYRKEFPGTTLPAVYTYPACISGFQPAVWNSDSVLAIGIDCFLGSDYPFYETTTYPRYISRRFDQDHLLPSVMKGYLQYHYPPQMKENNFLGHMVHEGKILYVLDRILPETADSLKIAYTASQMGWAETYEREIWAWFIDQELLYTSVETEYRKYLEESPFTSELGSQSAPRIGAFAGWRIVRKFMEENPDLSLAELMAEQDAQRILLLSKYKPR